MKTQAVKLLIPTNDGVFLAHYTKDGLVELNFPDRYPPGKAINPKQEVGAQIHAWHQATTAALKKSLAGEKTKRLPPFELTGTDFQKSVWREMQKIPAGETKSYGEIARAIGNPKAVRAVGGACGANPIPVFVPCHRVLAANKKIGGFSSGLHWKRKLLTREGIVV